MKKNRSNVILVLILMIGLSLILYPSVSDYWNSFRSSRAIVSYNDAVSNMDREAYQAILDSAVAYNARIAESGILWDLTPEQSAAYAKELSLDSSGIMGYIEIPRIDVSLPIYHGTAESVLQVAVGHIEGSSLPVGGKSTRCILSGHRGLPSARLFTDLDKLAVGDTFILRTLDEVLTYEVDQISIVQPYDLSNLLIEPGRDLCTLVTCTPYGVNSHRLLVQGHRVANVDEQSVRVTRRRLPDRPAGGRAGGGDADASGPVYRHAGERQAKAPPPSSVIPNGGESG